MVVRGITDWMAAFISQVGLDSQATRKGGSLQLAGRVQSGKGCQSHWRWVRFQARISDTGAALAVGTLVAPPAERGPTHGLTQALTLLLYFVSSSCTEDKDPKTTKGYSCLDTQNLKLRAVAIKSSSLTPR